jgi:AcrR family transcriptional regulator
MPKTRHIDNRRDALLDAAERVAIRLGAAHLTLDAVAKEAKVAKGGLIYHFPSKKALFQAMLVRALEVYGRSVQANLADPANRGDAALARIRLLTTQSKRLEQISTLVISIAVNYPKLLQDLQKRSVAFYGILAQDKSGDRAVIAMLAVHGLFLMERLGVGPFKKKRRAQLIQALCTLVSEAAKS